MESATLRAATCAASSLVAPRTRDVRHLGRPLGVGHHLLGQRHARLGERGGERGGCRRRAQAAGQHEHRVVGRGAAVDGDRVERRRRRPRAAPSAASACRRPRRSCSTASIVAMFGASIAAPLAMPPTVKPSPGDDDLLRHGVGGHDGPGRRGPGVVGPTPRRRRWPRARGSTVSIGNGMPISPVWQTSTSSVDAPMPPATTRHRRRSAASRPACAGRRVGVARRQDDARRAARRWRRGGPGSPGPGAAAARLDVNTPAAGTACRRRWRRRRRRARRSP